jgi:hypothetical protein
LTHDPIRIEHIQHPFGLTARTQRNEIARKITFPASPSFIDNYRSHREHVLPKITDVLTKKNVPFNMEE